MRDIDPCLPDSTPANFVNSKAGFLRITTALRRSVLIEQQLKSPIPGRFHDDSYGLEFQKIPKAWGMGCIVILSEAKDLAYCIYTRCRHNAMFNNKHPGPSLHPV